MRKVPREILHKLDGTRERASMSANQRLGGGVAPEKRTCWLRDDCGTREEELAKQDTVRAAMLRG